MPPTEGSIENKLKFIPENTHKKRIFKIICQTDNINIPFPEKKKINKGKFKTQFICSCKTITNQFLSFNLLLNIFLNQIRALVWKRLFGGYCLLTEG